LLVEEKDRFEPPGNKPYYYELINLDAYSGDKLIGKISGVENYGADDLLKISIPDKPEILVPYRNEFVSKIDLKNKSIHLNLIEGFLE